MGLSQQYLDSRRTIIPLRIQVRIHVAQARDALPVMSGPFPSERRPMAVSEVRSIEAAGKKATNQYCFFQSELGVLILKEGDIVEDIALGTFHSVESLSFELTGVRIKANCSETVNPTMVVK